MNKIVGSLCIVLLGFMSSVYSMDRTYSIEAAHPITQAEWQKLICDCIADVRDIWTLPTLKAHIARTNILNERAYRCIKDFYYKSDLQLLRAKYTVAAAEKMVQFLLKPKMCPVYDLHFCCKGTERQVSTKSVSPGNCWPLK